MSKPKFGNATKIKKASDETAGGQIAATLTSIVNDLEADRLDADEKTHPFHRITQEDADRIELVKDTLAEKGLSVPAWRIGDLSTQSIGDLLVARLKAQGYTLYFDEKVVAETLEKVRARLGGLLD